LCSRDAVFVKSIVTLPALAVSELASNFSWPSGLAASFSVGPPASLLAAGAGVEELLDVAGAAGALAGADAEELVLLDEPPQPARASRPVARVSIETLGIERVFARPAA
jgi:hypothetical protein